MGLGVAYAATYAATEGLKVLFGKPRPDLLSRCDPDIENARDHSVGPIASLGLVAWTICRDASKKVARDGFASFPSGHSSSTFAVTISVHGSESLTLVGKHSFLCRFDLFISLALREILRRVPVFMERRTTARSPPDRLSYAQHRTASEC